MEGVAWVTHRVDGELGCWTAVEWRPPHLRDAVDRLWHFTGRTAHPRERVLPTGLLQLDRAPRSALRRSSATAPSSAARRW